MSTWRALTKNLAGLRYGRRADLLAGIFSSESAITEGLAAMCALGLAKREGHVYTITGLGAAYAEGRVTTKQVRGKTRSTSSPRDRAGTRFVATWLMPLSSHAQVLTNDGEVNRIYPVELSKELCSP